MEWQNANKFIEDQILSLQQQNSNLNEELSNNDTSNKTEHPKLYLDNQKEEVFSLKSIQNGNFNEITEFKVKIDNLNMELESVNQKIESCDCEKRELQVANMDLLGRIDSLRIEKEEIEEKIRSPSSSSSFCY
jgi:chromosome segregation ATPase